MGEFPVAADEPGRSLRAADRNCRQAHFDPALLEETGFRSEPGSALPRREQPGCDSDTLRSRRRTLPPSEVRRGRERGSARGQMQKLPTVGKFHSALSDAIECNARELI